VTAPPRARTVPLAVAGLPAPVELCFSPRARRMSLRVEPAGGTVAVTVPAWVREDEAARFVARHAGWIERRLAALPPALPFADGAGVPVRGRDLVVRHDPSHRGGVRIGEREILVGGAPEFLARRVADALKAEARRLLADLSREKAARIGKRVAAVSVRDTTSRWGSCSSTGRLAYSWRLVLAPDFVSDYVAAHEVAHLAEMNHSRRFWRIVAGLTPHLDDGRAWLRANGAGLLRIGRS
jgi:predicted metal-dependent hydrolase